MADRYNNSRRSRSSGPTQYLLDLHAKLIPPTLHVSNKDRHASAMQTDQNTLKRLSAGPVVPPRSTSSPYSFPRAAQSHASLSRRDIASAMRGPCDTPARASEADDVSDLDGEMTDRLGDLHTLPSSRSRRRLGGGSSSDLLRRQDEAQHSSTRLDTQSTLACFYLCSGSSQTDPAKWLPADADTVRGIQPTDSALDFRWRPEVMANVFSGQAADQYERCYRAGKSLKHTQWSNFMHPIKPGSKVVRIPEVGPDAARKIMSKALKCAHPREIEVVNSTLQPLSSSHTFTFTMPRLDSHASRSQARLAHQAAFAGSTGPTHSFASINQEQSTASLLVPSSGVHDTIHRLTTERELTFHGTTLTVWVHADRATSAQLFKVRKQLERGRKAFDPVLQAPMVDPAPRGVRGANDPVDDKRRHGLDRSRRDDWADGPASDSEAEVEPRSHGSRRGSVAESERIGRQLVSGWQDSDQGSAEEAEESPFVKDPGDAFWLPISMTLVSRHPIYDTMLDYLRISWAMYMKNARAHIYQICKMLNHPTPRPGISYRLEIGTPSEPERDLTLEAVFPGELDFERGLVKSDFQLWPLLQVLDIDHIITCIEIAMSNSGRIIFSSQYPAMTSLAVHCLRYIVEPRGWDGTCVPTVHARDMSLLIEDPGPYIVGLASQCRQLFLPPTEAVVIDLDANSLTCKTPPIGVLTPRHRREKIHQRILGAFGPGYAAMREVPLDIKLPFSGSSLRCVSRTWARRTKPVFLGERLRPPTWWQPVEVLAALDKIISGKQKRPSLLQRLKGQGMTRQQAQLSEGEQVAKAMMRRRALHYVDARDELEHKVARANEKLLTLIRRGEKYKRQFEQFEKQADQLAMEAAELKSKIEREREEAVRLATISNEQEEKNSQLVNQLQATEAARAEAMRQLSDMHQSMQDLEREREQMMDIIEAQISVALDGVSTDGADGHSDEHAVDSRSDAPCAVASRPLTRLGDSAQRAPGQRRSRPGTGDSARTGMTAMTVESTAMSIAGMGRRAAAVIMSRPPRAAPRAPQPVGQINTPGRQSEAIVPGDDAIAARIAQIASKFEMTLNLLREQKPSADSQADQQPRHEAEDHNIARDSTDDSEVVDLTDDEASAETDSIAPAPSTSRAASVYPDMSVPSLIFDNIASDQKSNRRDSRDTAVRSLDDAPTVSVALGSPHSIVKTVPETETDIKIEGIDRLDQAAETGCPEVNDAPDKRLSGVSFMTVTFGEL